jgi:hypothetical protein
LVTCLQMVVDHLHALSTNHALNEVASPQAVSPRVCIAPIGTLRCFVL